MQSHQRPSESLKIAIPCTLTAVYYIPLHTHSDLYEGTKVHGIPAFMYASLSGLPLTPPNKDVPCVNTSWLPRACILHYLLTLELCCE